MKTRYLMPALTLLLISPTTQATIPNPIPTHTPIADAKATFFTRIKNVADSGQLFEPQAVARILELDLESSTADKTKQPADCSQVWMEKSVLVTTSHIAGDSWYQATPAGVRNMKVPGHFINPSTSPGPTAISRTR